MNYGILKWFLLSYVKGPVAQDVKTEDPLSSIDVTKVYENK